MLYFSVAMSLVTLLLIAIIALLIYQHRCLCALQRKIKADNKMATYLNEPMLAYLDTLAAMGQEYSEQGFRAFLVRRFGETEAHHYIATLQAEHTLSIEMKKASCRN